MEACREERTCGRDKVEAWHDEVEAGREEVVESGREEVETGAETGRWSLEGRVRHHRGTEHWLGDLRRLTHNI